jgi:hypothetical protein
MKLLDNPTHKIKKKTMFRCSGTALNLGYRVMEGEREREREQVAGRHDFR